MLPLPPFNVRPLRRKSAAKIATRGAPREIGESVPLSARLGGLKVKPQPARQKPQLKVLGEKTSAAC